MNQNCRNKQVAFPSTHSSSPNQQLNFRISVDKSHILDDSDLDKEIKDHPIHFSIIQLDNEKQYFSFHENCSFEDNHHMHSYLFYAENAFTLKHYAVSPIRYFAKDFFQVLYEASELTFNNEPHFFTKEAMQSFNEEQKQILLLGITTGIYYLYQKGYAINDLSLDYIFLDHGNPKIYAYVNHFNYKFNRETNDFCLIVDENDIVKRLVVIILEILNGTRAQANTTLPIPREINPGLHKLLERSRNSTSSNMVTLKEIADFFYNNNYCNHCINDANKLDQYQDAIHLTDNIDIQNVPLDSDEFSILKRYSMNTYNQDGLEANLSESIQKLLNDETKNIPTLLWAQMGIFKDPTQYPLLNRVPEDVIKSLVQYRPTESKFLFEMLCYERHDLLMLDFPQESSEILKLCRKPFVIKSPDDNYAIYCKIIEKASKETNYNIPKPYIPIAIIHLKKAAKEGHRQAIILLAKQYFRGKMVPMNYKKAIQLLSNPIFNNDEKVLQIINQIKQKLDGVKQAVRNLSQELQNLYRRAMHDNDPTIMVYVAFAFYSGLDGFPKSISHSVRLYRRASKCSPDYMCLLGSLYYSGIIFPRNLKRARNCFQRSAIDNPNSDNNQINTLKSTHSEMDIVSKPLALLGESSRKAGPLTRIPSVDKMAAFSIIPKKDRKKQYHFGEGCLKGKILDNIFRKHLWRSYMCFAEVNIDILITNYLQCPTSLSFDDSLILPLATFLSENTQIRLFYDSPLVSYFCYLDERSSYANLNRVETKLILSNIQYANEENYYYVLPYSNFDEFRKCAIRHLHDSGIQVHLPSHFQDKELPSISSSYIEQYRSNHPFCGVFAVYFDEMCSFNTRKQMINKDENLETSLSIFKFNNPVYQYKFSNESDDDQSCSQDDLCNDRNSFSYFPNITLPNSDPYLKSFSGLNESTNDTSNFEADNPMYSEKICISSEITKAESERNPLLQLKVANCYFDGLSGYPVNYKEAARFYKMSADLGNSYAQWKFAQMCTLGLGTPQDPSMANEYFTKSIHQENDTGMLRYALFIRHLLLYSIDKKDFELVPFQDFIEKAADEGNLEAIHQLAMSYESSLSQTDYIEFAIEKYNEAATHGHLESFIRLAQLVHSLDDEKLAKKYFYYPKYAVGLFNQELLLSYIEILNKEEKYEEARKIIDVGMKLNPDAYTAYFAENLSRFCHDSQTKNANIPKALQLLDHYLVKYKQENIQETDNITEKRKIWSKYEKYVMVKLLLLLELNKDDEAAQFLLQYKDCLSLKSKDDFILFYKKLNKQIAKRYCITISFYLPDYREIVESVKDLKNSNYFIRSDAVDHLELIIQRNPNNAFALLHLGKLYMKGMGLKVLKDSHKAVELIQQAALKECPEARLQCGKVHLYGYDCKPDPKMAFRYFWKAFDENNRDPRAGYYLSKSIFLPRKKSEPNQFTSPEIITKKKQEAFLAIAAEYGYRKALFKLGKRYVNDDNYGKQVKGKEMIMNASKQEYKKAKAYIKENSGKFSNNDLIDQSLSTLDSSLNSIEQNI